MSGMWGMTVDPERPFRHLCPEADMRDAMTDDEFWEHVDSSLMRVHEEQMAWYESWSVPELPEVQVDTPCDVCGNWTGPCGYDPDGLPYLHIQDGDG